MADMRYHLRTLVIVLTIAPPLLAGAWWSWQLGLTMRAQARPLCRPAFHQLGIALQERGLAEPARLAAPVRGESSDSENTR